MLVKSINFPTGIKINFYGNKKLLHYIDLSFPYMKNYNCYHVKQDVNIIYCGYIEDAIRIPKISQQVKSFSGPKYYKWIDKNIVYSYSPIDEFRGAHLVKNNGITFKVYIHKNETEEILCRIAREIILKNILSSGFFPIHAAVIKTENGADLFLGGKNSGKSTALLSSILFRHSVPMSGDIAFVKKTQNSIWKVLGWPWRISINKSFFDFVKIRIDEQYEERGKIRISPGIFCDIFNSKWSWEATINNIIKVDLDINKNATLKKISCNEIKKILQEVGVDSWDWGDSLNLGIIPPLNHFDDFSKDIPAAVLSGNIIKYYQVSDLYKIYD